MTQDRPGLAWPGVTIPLSRAFLSVPYEEVQGEPCLAHDEGTSSFCSVGCAGRHLLIGMTCFLYLVTNTQNGTCYVGKTRDAAERRWRRGHVANAKAGAQTYLANAIRKYGEACFDVSIIEEHLTDEAALDAEIFMIEYLRSLGASLYNMTSGGDGLRNPSSETRQRMALAKLGRRRKPFSDETRARIGAAARSRTSPVSAETRAKMSATRKGRTSPTKGKTWTFVDGKRAYSTSNEVKP